MTAIEEQKKTLKEICACVVRIPLLHEPPCKFSGEPLHESSGMINYFFDEIRKIIRCWEQEEPFMKRMQDAYIEVGKINDAIAFETPKNRKNDPEYNNLMLALHRESIQFRHDMRKVMKQIKLLENSIRKSNSDDDEVEEDDLDKWREVLG